MSSDKVNQLFWLNYAQAIKDLAGANLGPSGAFFIASQAQKGPLAGSAIPDEYTNQGLYDIANNLLADDNLFYNPSAQHGYAQALRTYLNNANAGGHPSAIDQANLNQANQLQEADQKYLDKQLDLADAQFKKEQKMGLTGDLKFYEWLANGNGQGYADAQQQLVVDSSQIDAIQARIGGPLAGQLKSDKDALAKGLNTTNDFTGFNMHGAVGDVLDPTEQAIKFKSGEKIPAPAFQRIPEYSAPQYKSFVQAIQTASAGGSYNPKNSVVFTVDTSKNTSDFNFGQTTAGAAVGGTIDGWFSFGVNGSHSEEHSTLHTGDETSSVSIKILYDDVVNVSITPGSWNVDISPYKLYANAPAVAKTLVRPSSLVCVSSLGYEITVGSTVASTLDTKLKETTSAGGSVSIFGIPLSFSGSGSHSSESDSHVATWDSASKTLKVVPSEVYGTCTVLGIFGEKFNILTA